jgi:hypothetical protein
MSFQPPRLPRLERPVNPEAVLKMQDLHARYLALGYGRRGKPWTQAQALALGRLYVQAWGTLPSIHRLRPEWCLPSAKTILGLFGDYTSYFQELGHDTRTP